MDTPFTFLDRAVTLRFYEEDPVELRLYLGDALEEKIAAAVGHYDAPHTLEEDVENFRTLVGEKTADRLLERAEPLDRLSVLELLSYTIRACREAQGKKLTALAEG